LDNLNILIFNETSYCKNYSQNETPFIQIASNVYIRK